MAGLNDIDEDYIDVESQRADVHVDDERAANPPPSWERAASTEKHVEQTLVEPPSDLVDEAGDGAKSWGDERIDRNAIIENDGRSNTRTFYYATEAPKETRRKYRRLLRWQEGEGASDRDVQNRAADRRRYVSGFCSRLDMAQYQRERVEHVMEGLNMSHMAHYSSQKVVLAIITLVANEDGWFIRDDDDFRELLSAVGSDLDEMKQIRGLVREKSTRL